MNVRKTFHFVNITETATRDKKKCKVSKYIKNVNKRFCNL